MGENICKQCYRQGINFPNIQTAHTAQYKKKKRLNIANYERNANKNYEILPHTGQIGHLEKVYNAVTS